MTALAGMAQENICLYFPLELGKIWVYEGDNSPDTLIAEISDTTTINGHLYYKYGPYGASNPYSQYWLRPSNNIIYALNTEDSTEYMLFNFGGFHPNNWAIPPVIVPPSTQPINQCDWSIEISIANVADTVYAANRTFYHPFGFIHGDRPCFDAGISGTRFKPDFGLVQFQQITEGDGVEWTLIVPPPDTLTMRGVLRTMDNPCLIDPCMPSNAAAMEVDDQIYILTLHDAHIREAAFMWNGIGVYPDDSLSVFGFTTEHMDIYGEPYTTLEIVNLARIETVGSKDLDHLLPEAGLTITACYPNPFNAQVNISYLLTQPGDVSVSIYDPSGRLVFRQLEGSKGVGVHIWRWQGIDQSQRLLHGGLYLVVVSSNGREDIRKILLIR